MKKSYRICAVILSVLLWSCNPIVSFAEESISESDITKTEELQVKNDTTTDVETNEDTVSSNEIISDIVNSPNTVSSIVQQNDVINVEISTVSEDMFSFILDPQGLIPATNAAKYGGAEFGEGNLFFCNEPMRYSNTSNYVEIINKSNVEVEFTVTAVLNMSADIMLADMDEFEEEACCIYMAIKDEDGEIPFYDNGKQKCVEITKVIPVATDANGTLYRFALTGACNMTDAWFEITEGTPTVDITWSWTVIEKEELQTKTYATEVVENDAMGIDIIEDMIPRNEYIENTPSDNPDIISQDGNSESMTGEKKKTEDTQSTLGSSGELSIEKDETIDSQLDTIEEMNKEELNAEQNTEDNV